MFEEKTRLGRGAQESLLVVKVSGDGMPAMRRRREVTYMAHIMGVLRKKINLMSSLERKFDFQPAVDKGATAPP